MNRILETKNTQFDLLKSATSHNIIANDTTIHYILLSVGEKNKSKVDHTKRKKKKKQSTTIIIYIL